MTTSDKNLQEMKSILEKKHDRAFKLEEAYQALNALKQIASITIDLATEEYKRKELLKESPKGFHLDKAGSCLICNGITSKENSWFDKYGLKCMICQTAINEKIIPGSITGNQESWYSEYELESYFNIKKNDLKRYIKESILKERTILGAGKKIHLQIFLIKDNKEVLPPKKLLKSRIVKVMHKGEKYYTQERWHEFIDHKLLKRLQKYKIVECLKETLSKPIESGRFLFKEINPLLRPRVY